MAFNVGFYDMEKYQLKWLRVLGYVELPDDLGCLMP